MNDWGDCKAVFLWNVHEAWTERRDGYHCVYQTRLHSFHFEFRLRRIDPLHHSYCSKGETKLSLMYLSGFSGSPLSHSWRLSSVSLWGGRVRLSLWKARQGKLLCSFIQTCSKCSLSSLCLVHWVFFFHVSVPRNRLLLFSIHLLSITFFLFGAITSYIMDIIQGLTNKGSLPSWAGLGHKHTDHVVSAI